MISSVPWSVVQEKTGRFPVHEKLCRNCHQPFTPRHGKGDYCYREECFQMREAAKRERDRQRRLARKGSLGG